MDFSKFAERAKNKGMNKPVVEEDKNVKTIETFNKNLGIDPRVEKNIKTGEEFKYDVGGGQKASYKDVIKNPKMAEHVVKNYGMEKTNKDFAKKQRIEGQNITPKEMRKAYEPYVGSLKDLRDYHKHESDEGIAGLEFETQNDDLLIQALHNQFIDEIPDDDEDNRYYKLNDDEKIKTLYKFLYEADDNTLNAIQDKYHNLIKHRIGVPGGK